ncbi:amidase [Caulobacter sp. KR2-114]|uniref:amidase n=1 Tax=Caulobacter sp. KR2-114 TaxID=3400912 RepID=UPI003C1029DC
MSHTQDAGPAPAERACVADPATPGAAQLARAIAAGETTVLAVMQAHLARIAKTEPLIHAFAHRDDDAALEAAQAADDALARGEPTGPLHGAPVSIKDWIEAEGLPCDGGFEARAGFRPRRDATVVSRLRAAGAIVLGKTVTREGEPLHARPNNPHDLAHCPGGSSSGEAAAIAAGASPLGLGSDSGGSIRLPAAWSGVLGLKPTQGRVPLTGHFPAIGHLSDPRTVIGPLARRAEDLALALRVIAGPDGVDPSAHPVPLGDPAAVSIAGLRIGLTDLGGADLTPAAWTATQDLARRLEGLGAVVAPLDLPLIDEALAISNAYWARPESMSHRQWRPWGPSTLPADAVEESLFRWERLQRRLETVMADWDVLLCPAAPGPAPAHRLLDARDYLYTLPFSLTAQPVVSLPAGRAGSLPLGAQLVGRRWREDVLLALAMALERA